MRNGEKKGIRNGEKKEKGIRNKDKRRKKKEERK